MYSFFNLQTFNALELTSHDRLFLHLFHQAKDNEKIDLIKKQKIEVIARTAYHEKEFETFCNREELRSYWEEIWCSYGAALSLQKKLPVILFFSQPQLNQFNLVRGAFFFNLSQEMRKEIKRDFGYSEMEAIKMAIQYGSVHAVQRYNDYLYSKLQQASDNDAEALYQELIANSERMLPHYGSYGYMVLAEAFTHYCFWLVKEQEIGKMQLTHSRVLESLDKAEQILKESHYSIQNASIGQGLKYSNSLGFDSPAPAREFFLQSYEALLKSVCTSNSMLLPT